MKMDRVKWPIAAVLLVALLPALGFAQKAEVSLGYSYLQQNTKIAVDSPQHFFQSFLGGLNGGDAAVTFNFNKVVGLKFDFAGYTQSPNFAGSDVFTYTAGPVIKKHSGVFNPFGELLVGGAHKSVNGFNFSGGQNAFTGIVGGGIDLKLSKHFSLRAAEVDYVWTAFHTIDPTNYLVVSSRQNNFRYVGGVVVSF